MKLQTLYKKNTQGKIEEWSISVFVENKGKAEKAGYCLRYGELKGAKQVKFVTVKSGKNLGKKNATTHIQQAHKEAEAKFKKMLKQGYVKSLKDAKAGKTDKIIKGGIIPMAAHKWQKYADKIQYPVMVQPKLDGERCVAIYKDGKVTLWTRSRKPILSCPHIIEQLQRALNGSKKPRFLDGELYKHGLKKKELEKLMGAVRKQKPSELSSQVEFHIYDGDLDESFAEHAAFKNRWFEMGSIPDWLSHIKFVETNVCNSQRQVDSFYRTALRNDYEGLMVRDPFAPYQNKRTKALLKYKPRDDAEFKIVDIVPGEDKTVVFKCKTKEGKTFGATKSGNKDDNQKYLKNKKKYIGKFVTVEYQGLTGEGKPLFPSALRIREKV